MKRILDEKTKRILSGMLPFSPNSFVAYTPEEFLSVPADLQPVFNVRPFDKATIEKVRTETQGNKFEIEAAKSALRYSVTAWSNLIDLGTSEEIAYSLEAFDLLPESLIWVLYGKCSEMTFGISKAEKESLELQQRLESEPLNKAAQSADLIQS